MSHKWKSAVLLFIPGLSRYGLRATLQVSNETLSNVVGYFVAALLALYFCGLVYAHFDRKRRMYKMVDRILDPVFNGVLRLLGVREK